MSVWRLYSRENTKVIIDGERAACKIENDEINNYMEN